MKQHRVLDKNMNAASLCFLDSCNLEQSTQPLYFLAALTLTQS